MLTFLYVLSFLDRSNIGNAVRYILTHIECSTLISVEYRRYVGRPWLGRQPVQHLLDGVLLSICLAGSGKQT